MYLVEWERGGNADSIEVRDWETAYNLVSQFVSLAKGSGWIAINDETGKVLLTCVLDYRGEEDERRTDYD